MRSSIIRTAVIAASALAMLGTAAQAGEGYGRGYGYGGGYGGYHRPAPHYAPPAYQPHVYHQERRRNQTGERIAKGVLIGVGAVILGSILANEARRHDRGY